MNRGGPEQSEAEVVRAEDAVTAEVAGSSPVVPAIDSKRVIWKWRNPIGVQKSHRNVPVLHPILALYIRGAELIASSMHVFPVPIAKKKQAT